MPGISWFHIAVAICLMCISYATSGQLTIDRRELKISLASAAHWQTGKEAPYHHTDGTDLLEFRDRPGAFLRYGLSAEYVIKGYQQFYTKNRTARSSIRVGFDKGIKKTYFTNWIDLTATPYSPLRGQIKFWNLNLAYHKAFPVGHINLGYGIGGQLYRFNSYPLQANQQLVTDGFYSISQYGPSAIFTCSAALEKFDFELSGELQWLWNHNVLGYKEWKDEPPLLKRIGMYSSIYSLLRFSIGYRINFSNMN